MGSHGRYFTRQPPSGSTIRRRSAWLYLHRYSSFSLGLQPLCISSAERRAHWGADALARAGWHAPHVEWHSMDPMDGGVGYASTVLIQPGPAGTVLRDGGKAGRRRSHYVTGTSKDARRLEVAKALGADDVIDVQKEDALARILEITQGALMPPSIATAGGTAPCCSASRRPSAGAQRWSCKAKGGHLPDFRLAGSRGRASRSRAPGVIPIGPSARVASSRLVDFPRADDDVPFRLPRSTTNQVSRRRRGTGCHPRVCDAVEIASPRPAGRSNATS